MSRLCSSLSIGVLTALAGCVSAHDPYRETHHIRDLTIVFLDPMSLQTEYGQTTGKPGTSLSSRHGVSSVTSVHGFYDFATNTLYCSKMDFEVCGHELHHAALGRFHDQ